MDYCWLEPLYSKGLTEKQRKKAVDRISQGEFHKDIWIVALPFGGTNMLEIYPSYVFLQKGFPYKEAKILGIAKKKNDAFDLVAELVDEAYQATGTAQIRAYYEKKMAESHSGGKKG